MKERGERRSCTYMILYVNTIHSIFFIRINKFDGRNYVNPFILVFQIDGFLPFLLMVYDHYKSLYDGTWENIISVFHWFMIREQFVVFNENDEVKHFIRFIPFHFFFLDYIRIVLLQ